MELEGSLPYLQESSIGPYPEPGRSIPSRPISLRSILMFYSHLHASIHSGLFPSGFPTNILYAFLAPIHTTWSDHLLDFVIQIILGE
jgi:hypothetical protein